MDGSFTLHSMLQKGSCVPWTALKRATPQVWTLRGHPASFVLLYCMPMWASSFHGCTGRLPPYHCTACSPQCYGQAYGHAASPLLTPPTASKPWTAMDSPSASCHMLCCPHPLAMRGVVAKWEPRGCNLTCHEPCMDCQLESPVLYNMLGTVHMYRHYKLVLN